MSHLINIRCRVTGERQSDTAYHLSLIRMLLESASQYDLELDPAEWLLATGERASSYLYGVYDGGHPSTAALAVLHEDFKSDEAVKILSIWNGKEDKSKAGSISYYFDRKDSPSNGLRLTLRSKPDSSRLGNWQNVANVLSSAVSIFGAHYASVETPNYEGVFGDKVGVGWMLYLSRILTVQQVPEARALVPVIGKDEKGNEKQIGTIIVSVTDEPFSDENPEHVKIANAIEIRLVDQDLLPRFSEL